MKLHEMKSLHRAALDKAESFITAAEAAGRTSLTPAENDNMNAAIHEAEALAAKIQTSERVNTIRRFLDTDGRLIPGGNGVIDAPSSGFDGPMLP